MARPTAPGLRWLNKGRQPIWFATPEAIRSGYQPRKLDLTHIADHPDILRARCAALQADLNLWMLGYRRWQGPDDRSIGTLLDTYQSHPDSPFHHLRPGTISSYTTYIGTLRALIGERLVADVTGMDLMRWNREWSADGRYLAKAQMMRTVMLAALSFGAALRMEGCATLSTVVRETRRVFKSPKPRTQIIAADEVVAVRKAAHAAGRPSAALAYAIVFETTLRLFDVMGQWWPAGRMLSDIVDADGRTWVGLRWEDVDDDLVLRYVPSKTAGSTGKRIIFPLQAGPMVVEELRYWSAKHRAGPMIVSEISGLPYNKAAFGRNWRIDRKAAGLAPDLWARDLRASGITEARAAGVGLDDAAKVAGHAGTRTTGDVYDRALIEASMRFSKARTKLRNRK